MVKMMSQDKMIGKREILSSSPSPRFSRSLRTMLLLLMMMVGVGEMWGQDLPFVVTTDPENASYYLLQNVGTSSFYAMPYDNIENIEGEEIRITTTNVPNSDMRFYFVSVEGEEGYYYIIHCSGKYLYAKGVANVDGGARLKALSTQQTEIDRYKFSIVKDGDGYYILNKSLGNSAPLCKRGGNTGIGYKDNNNKDYYFLKWNTWKDNSGNRDDFFRWNFIPVSDTKPIAWTAPFTPSTEDNYYYYKIKNSVNNSFYISGNTSTNKVNTSSTAEIDDITWIFKEVPADGNGSDKYITYYYIINAFTGEYMCFNGVSSNYTQNQDDAIILQTKTETNEQKCQFIITRSSQRNVTTHYNIIPKVLKDYYWDNQCVGQKDKTDETNVRTATDRDGDTNPARWIFEPATGYPAPCADPLISCDEDGVVNMTCTEDGAAIHYTIADGMTAPDDPTETDALSTTFSNPITSTKTIKAIAIKGPHVSSVVTQTIVYVPNQTFESSTYDGTDKTPVVKVGETTISSDEYTVTYEKAGVDVTEHKDAGTYTVTITDKVDGDYIVYGSGTMTISPKALSITAKDNAITYGDAPAGNGVTYSGFIEGENENTEGMFTGTLGYTSSYSQFGDVGDAYTITPDGLTAANYDITFVDGTLMVNPKEVGLSWSTPTSFTYDGTAHTLTATATGTVNGDVIGVTVTTSAKEGSSLTGYDAINAGSYTATASTLTLNGTDTPAGNYTLPAANTQDFTISQKALTIKANDKSIVYGEEADNAGVTYSGFIEGENENTEGMFTGTLGYAYNSAADGSGDAYMTTSDVGSYFIIPSGLTATNYDITFENGTLTVDQKEVGIEWSNTSLAYNGLEQKPTATATGLVNNDEIGVTVEGAQTDIGTGYTATATGLTGTGGKEGNYKLPTPNPSTTFEITTAVLIVTANDKAIIFGDEPSNSGVTYSGFIVGQDESTPGVLSGTLSYSYNTAEDGLGTEYSAGSNAGTYYIIPSGLTSTDYEVRFVAGTLTVNPKVVKDNPDTGAGEAAITILLSDIPEGGYVYDGTAKTPTVTVKYGDTVIPSGDGGEYTVEYTSNINAGTNTATVTITDKDGGNYTVSGTTTFSIGKAPLTATADNVNITYGDVAPASYTISYTGFVNNENETAITTAPTAACTYTQGNDAGNYAITVTDDGVAVNYEITPVDGTLTVGPKTVSNPTIEISETSFEYDGTEKKPDVTSVKDGDTDIPSGQYLWSWSNNINAAGSTDENAPTVIVTNVDNGNYTINGTVTFTITPKSIGNGTTSAEGVAISFDENENVKITCPIENLIKDKDFTVSGPTDEVWTITGIGNYSGGAQVMRIVEDFYNTGVATGENIKDVAAFQASTDMVISGKDVYIVTDVNLTKHKVVLSKITYAPKDTPVLLLTDLEGTDLETTAGIAATPIQVETGDEADTSGNILKRLSGAEGLQVTFGKVFMFYLGKFVLTTEGTLEAGSFYFDNPNPPSSSAAGVRLSIVIDETTDIDGIKEYDNTGTAIDRWYSLDGRRLNGKPTKKGLYIKNGQKVVVK